MYVEMLCYHFCHFYHKLVVCVAKSLSEDRVVGVFTMLL
jgi:hypothetical protein